MEESLRADLGPLQAAGPERGETEEILMTFDDFLDGCAEAERRRLAEIDANLPFTDD